MLHSGMLGSNKPVLLFSHNPKPGLLLSFHLQFQQRRGKQRHKTLPPNLSSTSRTVVSFQFSHHHQTNPCSQKMPSEDSKPVRKEEQENDEKPNNGKKNNHPKSNEEAAEVKKEPVKDNGGGSVEKPIAKKKPNTPKVKKEEEANKKKPNNAKKTQVKKEDDYDSDDEKPISTKKPNEVDKKKNKVKKEEEKKKGGKEAENGKKKEKKVYDLPGQKRDPPEERDPLRIFYESLYEQVPGSEMAAFWLMECGLLPKEVAKKVFEKKQKKSQLQKLGSPMKTVVTVKKTSKSVTVKKETSASPVSSQKKKTPDSKVKSKQTKKRKIEDDSCSEDGSDDDFVLSARVTKRQKVA